jgi:hypothetical protein
MISCQNGAHRAIREEERAIKEEEIAKTSTRKIFMRRTVALRGDARRQEYVFASQALTATDSRRLHRHDSYKISQWR